jgi:hypothetical protein
VTLTGPVEQIAEQLWLRGNADRPAVRLAPLDASNKVQWDFATKAPLPLEPEEASAHARLKRAIAGQAAPISGTVTGTVSKDDHGFIWRCALSRYEARFMRGKIIACTKCYGCLAADHASRRRPSGSVLASI